MPLSREDIVSTTQHLLRDSGHHLTREVVHDTLNALIASLAVSLANRMTITFRGFGTFRTVDITRSVLAHPGKASERKIVSFRKISFKPGGSLKRLVNRK